jgi:hypothetical protein
MVYHASLDKIYIDTLMAPIEIDSVTMLVPIIGIGATLSILVVAVILYRKKSHVPSKINVKKLR